MKLARQDITAIILAGGQGRRMGGQDKGLIEFEGKPLAALLIEKLERQEVAIAINANRNRERYRAFGYPVISDRLDDYQGPLAGFASAMSAVDSRYILTLPCDGPRLAHDYVARFIAAAESDQSGVLVAHDGERLQPVHAMIDVGLLPSLERFLDSGDRKIDRWYAQYDFCRVDFSDCADMFRNINTPSDHESLQAES
jgi:molybdenum cofactor guanylyltransferase